MKETTSVFVTLTRKARERGNNQERYKSHLGLFLVRRRSRLARHLGAAVIIKSIAPEPVCMWLGRLRYIKPDTSQSC